MKRQDLNSTYPVSIFFFKSEPDILDVELSGFFAVTISRH